MAEQARIARQLYREFLTLNRRLPAQEAKANLDQIKSKLSELRASSDEAKHSDALKELVAKTSFLRVMAPRRPGDHSITAARFIWRDGEIIEGEAERPDLRCVQASPAALLTHVMLLPVWEPVRVPGSEAPARRALSSGSNPPRTLPVHVLQGGIQPVLHGGVQGAASPAPQAPVLRKGASRVRPVQFLMRDSCDRAPPLVTRSTFNFSAWPCRPCVAHSSTGAHSDSQEGRETGRRGAARSSGRGARGKEPFGGTLHVPL